MTCIALRCPHWQSAQTGTRGKTRRGTQRSLGQNPACPTGSFLLDSRHRGGVPAVQPTSVDMRLNARGLRDTARGLRSSTDTGRSERTKQAALLASGTPALLRTLHPEPSVVDREQAGEAAIAAMGACGGHKGHPRWLWPASAHPTGAVWASGVGRRKDEGLLRRKAFLAPFGLTRFYTDHWGAYPRPLAPDVHRPGQRPTQKIARKHLTLRTRRTRFVRNTICVSKTIPRPDIVLGFFVNRSACGLLVYMLISTFKTLPCFVEHIVTRHQTIHCLEQRGL
jgi:insertion element IS1 protein InsB